MKRTIGIGEQDFARIITKNLFYIDKTSFIKEWWENGESVTLITRPRRFGKTLNLNMLDYFFSNQHSGRGDLFEGLAIWQEEKYRNLQGTHPVISLSFASIKETTYEEAKKKIYQVIVELYEKNRFLLEEGFLKGTEIDFFHSVHIDMEETTATYAIYKLSRFLYNYYGEKVLIFLDEYDTPMQEAYVNGFWEELTGFTEEEVFAALDEFDMGEEKEGVKFWYDGFIFGKHADIYNPWSVLHFLEKKEYDTYWANTSGNRLVSKLIREGNKKIKSTFESLLKDESVYCPLDEQIVYNQLDGNENAIWSLLLASGYLKVLHKQRAGENETAHYRMMWC